MKLTENDIAALCGGTKAAKRAMRVHRKKHHDRSKVLLLLRMIDAAGGYIDASDDPHSLLTYFCDDRGLETDTLNLAVKDGLIRTTHDDIFETSRAFLTAAGRAALEQKRSRTNER